MMPMLSENLKQKGMKTATTGKSGEKQTYSQQTSTDLSYARSINMNYLSFKSRSVSFIMSFFL